MNERIPLSEPCIHGNEWKYIKDCLDTGWVSSTGRYVDLFDQKICEYTGAKHAVACINGTSALQVALQIAGVKAGDEVLVPTLTFIAPINAIHYLNARPVFMDSDSYYNIDAEKTVRFVKEESFFKGGYSYNRTTRRRISAIVPVHVFGNGANLAGLLRTCRNRNIAIVEDASESLGTRYSEGELSGRHTGTIGDIGCLSFNGNKIITCSGGGMLLTDNSAWAEKARYLTTQAKDDKTRYIHNEVGYNFRMTNIQAAFGIAQLEQLPEFLENKKRNYETYKKAIDNIQGLHLAETPPFANNNCWMYGLQIDRHAYGKDREELMAFLSGKKIETRPVWYLNHLQKPYQDCQTYQLEKAIKLHRITLNIPCSVTLTQEQIQAIMDILRQ